jgi:hypothetical protein
MRAQVVLTPPESKCLISKAIAGMDIVKKAASSGTIVIHPSSTTYYLVKELTGDIPRTDHFVLGGVFPQGLCTEQNSSGKRPPAPSNEPPQPPPKWMADRFPYKWVIKDGTLTSGIQLGKILEEIKPDDVYVKGVNAVDTRFNTGVLFGHDGGGTIARVIREQKIKGFNVILAAGLEKLIPNSIAQAAKAMRNAHSFDYGMGMPCGLYPVRGGTTVTEIQAVEILSGANTTVISAGGVGGAEGAVTLAIEGTDAQVKKAIEYVEQSKGAKIPVPRPAPCQLCGSGDCFFPVRDKHWYPRWG